MLKKYLKQLSLPESYISITLGFLVVIVAGLLAYNYFSKNKPTETQTQEQQTQQQIEVNGQKYEEKTELPATYTVVAGDTLWSIAEKYYQSGYNWVTIARENKLANVSVIEVGQKLSIPKAGIIKPASENIAATATEAPKTYTVAKGDYLWKIAVEQLGDGFAWTKIAQLNKLANPSLIHPGNVLTLPR